MEYFLYFSTSFLQSYGVLIYRLARSGDDSQPDLPAYIAGNHSIYINQ